MHEFVMQPLTAGLFSTQQRCVQCQHVIEVGRVGVWQGALPFCSLTCVDRYNQARSSWYHRSGTPLSPSDLP